MKKIFVLIFLFLIFAIKVYSAVNYSYKPVTHYTGIPAAQNKEAKSYIQPIEAFGGYEKCYIKDGYRYCKAKLSNNYVEQIYEEGDPMEPAYTDRGELYNLFYFQSISPQKRIEKFEAEGYYEVVPVSLTNYYQQYKIAKDYCIQATVNQSVKDWCADNNINESSFWFYLSRVQCTNNAIPIELLPYERGTFFERRDALGQVYYLDYDISKVWEEFRKKGIRQIEEQVEKEFEAVKHI